MAEEYKQKSITLTPDHIEAVEKQGLNLSKYVRRKLEEDYPEYFED